MLNVIYICIFFLLNFPKYLFKFEHRVNVKRLNVKLMFCRVSFFSTQRRGKSNDKKKQQIGTRLVVSILFMSLFLFYFFFLFMREYYIYLVTACYACQRIIYCFQRFFTPASQNTNKILYKIT